MKVENIDGLIFDLDGTLWDASASCAKAWNTALKESGIEDFVFDEAMVRSVSGLRIEKIMENHFAFLPAIAHADFLALYRKHEAQFVQENGGRLYPLAKETLAELKRTHQLFIVSNCNTGYIENFLGFHNLQHLFADFECSGNTGLPKSENIKLILNRNRLKHAVYIGDTVWDEEAAREANIPFIHAAFGFGKANRPPYTINAIAKLTTLLSHASFP